MARTTYPLVVVHDSDLAAVFGAVHAIGRDTELLVGLDIGLVWELAVVLTLKVLASSV